MPKCIKYQDTIHELSKFDLAPSVKILIPFVYVDEQKFYTLSRVLQNEI